MSLGTLLLIVTFKLRISLVFMRAPCDLSVFTRDSFLRCQRFYCSTIRRFTESGVDLEWNPRTPNAGNLSLNTLQIFFAIDVLGQG